MNAKDSELRFTRILVLGTLAINVALSLALAIAGRSLNLYAGPLVFAGLAVVLSRLIKHFSDRGRSLGLFLAFVTLNLFLVVPEQILWVSGFRFESGISAVPRFAYPSGSEFFSSFIPDEKLFWRYAPDAERVNSWGFKGGEVRIRKPKGVYRILFLGDSCTEQGFPYLVQEELNKRYAHTGIEFECVVLATSGYSSHQGLVVAKLFGDKVEPDLVVVFFGWNDHWLAQGAIDSQKIVRPVDRPSERFFISTYRKIRLLQFLNWAFHKAFPMESDPVDVRVPLPEYEKNLAGIRAEFTHPRIPVVFLTAPTAYYRFGVPAYILERRYGRSADEVLSLHRKYNDAVRDIASSDDAVLLDLENSFRQRMDLRSIFTEDNIHFTQEGLRVVAGELVKLIGAKILPGDSRISRSQQSTE